MPTETTTPAAPGTPDRSSRSPPAESPQFKLRPAESATDATQPPAESDDANTTPAVVPAQSEAESNATPQDIFLMLNAVQQLHQQGQQSQASTGAAPHSDPAEEAAPGSPAQQGTPPPNGMQDLQLDPALMGSGVPPDQQPPGVPPQQQHLPQQPPLPHQLHHPHMHHQPSLLYHHPPPQYIPSGYPPPGGHPMPPPPELQQIPQQPVRPTRSGRAGTLAQADSQYEDDGDEGDNSPTFIDPNAQANSGPSAEPATPSGPGGKKGGKWAAQDTVDWQRKRKDNHKEVERRRRSNINDGINELARMVPNVGAEKAKGAILSRSVQYIHDLKENEARNIEKWTLEKLLMDQAMGDLQAQLDEMRQRLEEERQKREQVEAQLAEVLRAQERAGEEPAAKRPRVE